MKMFEVFHIMWYKFISHVETKGLPACAGESMASCSSVLQLSHSGCSYLPPSEQVRESWILVLQKAVWSLRTLPALPVHPYPAILYYLLQSFCNYATPVIWTEKSGDTFHAHKNSTASPLHYCLLGSLFNGSGNHYLSMPASLWFKTWSFWVLNWAKAVCW